MTEDINFMTALTQWRSLILRIMDQAAREICIAMHVVTVSACHQQSVIAIHARFDEISILLMWT